ncbi:hypothetical protein [Rhizorhabdus argentea]|uniref:hypothetical protein n=1 Tax=Rhizorhabdus argentea TaxID=1387174 RepID=UPI0030EB73A5
MIASVAVWLFILPRSAEADGLIDRAKQIVEVRPLDDRKGIPKPAAKNVQIPLRQETHGYYLWALIHVFFQATNQNRTTPGKGCRANCFIDGFYSLDLPAVAT